MDFNLEKINLKIFEPLLKKRPEISLEQFEKDLTNYYLPFARKLIDLKDQKKSSEGIIVGVSAIQGAGKTTQGEILELLINFLGFSCLSLSIDDFYITHQQLNELREKDPRFIRRGVTHDILLAIKTLKALQEMEKNGEIVKVPVYDKGAYQGDGDRVSFKEITKGPEFIFFDGWMLGARKVEDESIFETGLPALDTQEHIQFAKDVNKKLEQYYPLWEKIEFMNVLYVPDYQISLKWRDQAEEILRKQGKGMTSEQIREFVYYFWRSVHPGIQIKALAQDEINTDQVVIINDDHSIKEVLTPKQVIEKY